MPAGVYTVVISAAGFNDARKEKIKVDDGANLPVDLRLEIAPIEADVDVTAGAIKANSDPVYQQLRLQGKTAQDFSGPYAMVNNLVLKKEGAASL